MLPRSLRTGGCDLPGVESYSVPLIGYRPLSPDSPSSQSGRSAVEVDSAQSTVVEEEEEGIIYTVMVKPQHSAPYSSRTGSSRTQSVKAGTEEKLVLHLLHCLSTGDASYVTIFLCTYRSFISTRRVLDILADRLEDPPGSSESSPTRQAFNRAVCSVFITWLSEYPEDFEGLGEPSCLLRLAPLLPSPELRARMLQLAEELSERALMSPTRTEEPPPPPPDPSDFEPTHILGFPTSLIGEQLTRIETELFVRLVPYHCLGSLWSQRDKKGREGQCWSVRATVRQFNRLTNAVLASCLWNTRLRSQQRARLLEKWISVAEECRVRKNFSSLYAIVSALQSNPLHRLRRSWQHTDRESLRRYEELTEIFSDKDNYSQSRELLKEEGTSKFANLDNRLNNKNFSKSSAQGTVPYLGLFLTDLTMLDTAVKDRLDNGYINFDKRRREFEVLAQIRLLQSSCKNCTFRTEPAFVRWYHSVPKLSEADSYRLSNEIEAASDPGPRGATPTVIITQCSDLSGSRSSLPTDSDSLFDFTSPVNHLLSKLTKHMRSPSVSCLDVDSSPPTAEPSPAALTPSSPTKSHRRSASCGNNPPGGSQGSGPDMRIIRIRMEIQDGNLYRSILVTSNDKTPTVISSALEKHNQDPREVPYYELLQLLPEDKELLIPPTGNVFYAMSSSSVDFLLRRKGGTTPLGSQPISTETSATYPRIKSKGRRLVRTLF
ncbi:ral guanine nucleotide dissociation stimulator-like 2 isoform X2 [Periophthalmus magnuspinnatus]|uniref:ral guanine nucleotide dissociation stimulator-like 2 isoform X2 n=1 Tax=Periophthalmus magnuspinnatus TaxID=409849 RepID=UPI0024364016|nr:ral guanine nucleotide dissociation stimulator-like 2 isoform X2 [Periophthalmus magnuspinnatus]